MRPPQGIPPHLKDGVLLLPVASMNNEWLRQGEAGWAHYSKLRLWSASLSRSTVCRKLMPPPLPPLVGASWCDLDLSTNQSEPPRDTRGSSQACGTSRETGANRVALDASGTRLGKVSTLPSLGALDHRVCSWQRGSSASPKQRILSACASEQSEHNPLRAEHKVLPALYSPMLALWLRDVLKLQDTDGVGERNGASQRQMEQYMPEQWTFP